MSIQLHPEKGLNPHLTICPQCGKDGPELLLLGAVDKVYKCTTCNMTFIGKPQGGRCPKCCVQVFFDRNIEEGERLPGGLCDDCLELNEQVEKIVKEGGIHWKCKKCGSAGAIKAEAPLAKAVREQLNIPPPDPCGVAFTEAECPVCSPEQS